MQETETKRRWAFEGRGAHVGFRSQDDEGEFVCLSCDLEEAAVIVAAHEERIEKLEAALRGLLTACNEEMLVIVAEAERPEDWFECGIDEELTPPAVQAVVERARAALDA